MAEQLFRCIYDGEAFVPQGASALAADEAFGAGEVVALCPFEARSSRSHNHYFAEISEMWQTLPESLADLPYAASPETLRKHALIATGHCEVKAVDCGSAAAAQRVAAFANDDPDYVLVKIEGASVLRFRAKSQRMRAMGKEAFQKSKDDVLNWIGALLENGRAAA